MLQNGWPAIPAQDSTLKTCTGFGELWTVCTSIFKVSLEHGGGEAHDAASASWLNVGAKDFCVSVENGGCDGSPFSSANGVSNVHTICFDIAGSRGSRVVYVCPSHLFSLMNQLPSVNAHSFQSGISLVKCGLDCVGKRDSWLWLKVHVSAIKRNFFSLVSVLGWRALRVGSLVTFLCFHFALGLLRARSLIQVGLWLFRRGKATVFQTATMCICQLWQGSRISLLTQKGGA